MKKKKNNKVYISEKDNYIQSTKKLSNVILYVLLILS